MRAASHGRVVSAPDSASGAGTATGVTAQDVLPAGWPYGLQRVPRALLRSCGQTHGHGGPGVPRRGRLRRWHYLDRTYGCSDGERVPGVPQRGAVRSGDLRQRLAVRWRGVRQEHRVRVTLRTSRDAVLRACSPGLCPRRADHRALEVGQSCHVLRSASKGGSTADDPASGWLEVELMPLGVGVVLDAAHTCMSIRGARSVGATTRTSAFSGEPLRDAALWAEFLGAESVRE